MGKITPKQGDQIGRIFAYLEKIAQNVAQPIFVKSFA
jgi:hypothetical protein